DALGFSESYEYDRHLLKKETDKNGLSFHFEYDGRDETAKCIRTWGDGGIYDHKLSYDDEINLTTVVNSLGHRTQYQHAGGLVVRTVDPNGATWLTKHSEHMQLLEETDPLGNATVYAYDARGNTAEVAHPDGAKIAIEYDGQDNPVSATDAAGGQWAWRYDERGRLVERVDPLGRSTKYEYRGTQLVGVTDPEGQITGLSYDAAGNVDGIFTPDGASSRWKFDAAGRAVVATNAEGARQQRELDVMGRILRVHEPDGNVRELRYDAEGNVIHARDQQHDVRFAYQGMGRLSMRSEAGTSVRFRYDTEEQLTAIENERSRVYGFSLDPSGEVSEERGFDGLRRRYTRDLIGRVTDVERPGGMHSRYEYDAAGRVTAVHHGDGSTERYAYRPDGELIEAKNDAASVAFERDALGRIVKEQCGKHWVASEYGPLGLRSRMESSLGAKQEIERNAMGDVTAVTGSFEARFERDMLGQELSRELPGGVRSKWQRDKLGRPVVHEIWSGQQNHRTVRYEWDANDRLVQLLDAHRGPIRFGHDPLGNLAWAQYPDGSRELRVPDAVGNLFRREDRRDRKYGDAGQLLESTDDEGRVTRYEYDAEGNLARKLEPYGRVWRYHWNAAGMLQRVDRPDGRRVWFTYDALGRRLSKTFRGKTTRWLWDGNNPLHEWVEDAKPELSDDTWDEKEDVRRDDGNVVAMHPPTGPPEAELAFADESAPYLDDAATEAAPITWLFEPESFSPMAKLEGDSAESILTDHLGTPVAMLDDGGELTWSAQLDTYGDVRTLDAGGRGDCPFRFPGQYEDPETGLYYNRFRYYDPAAGVYVSQDPIGLDGGIRPHGYVADPYGFMDPLGLKACGPDEVTWYHGSMDAPGTRKKGFSTRNRYGDDRGAPYACVSTDRRAAEDAISPSSRYDVSQMTPEERARTGIVEGRMSRTEWDQLHRDGHLKTNNYEGFKHNIKGGTETKAMTPEGVEALNRSMVR
ncbi:MAG: RHS repeat-associated core domain-containing protein, partial [Myxococcales bacterium]